jgi:hypothetical protein
MAVLACCYFSTVRWRCSHAATSAQGDGGARMLLPQHNSSETTGGEVAYRRRVGTTLRPLTIPLRWAGSGLALATVLGRGSAWQTRRGLVLLGRLIVPRLRQRSFCRCCWCCWCCWCCCRWCCHRMNCGRAGMVRPSCYLPRCQCVGASADSILYVQCMASSYRAGTCVRCVEQEVRVDCRQTDRPTEKELVGVGVSVCVHVCVRSYQPIRSPPCSRREPTPTDTASEREGGVGGTYRVCAPVPVVG